MTKNAYLFVWTEYGIENIVPITQFENWDAENMWKILQDKQPEVNPLGSIISYALIRARYNSERRYEVYAMDCEEGITEQDLYDMWENSPQYAADITRAKGVCLFGASKKPEKVKIV